VAGTWYDPRVAKRNSGESHRQRETRKSFDRPGLITGPDGAPLRECRILDVSSGGARLKVDQTAGLPEAFTLVLSWSARTTRRCQVRWRSETELGVQFQLA
jgi:hypothetical protein